MGADVESLGRVLGSSLYTGKEAQVITKELIQNSMDAVRGMKGGNVSVEIERYQKTITITDNGKGMSPEEVSTVFLDLGASGKRGQADASGGFGLAKAAPLMMSDSLTLETVADVPGRGRIKTTLEATPDQLLHQGVDLKTEKVGMDTPTGTKIVSRLPQNAEGWYEADRFLAGFDKSINPPVKLKHNRGFTAFDRNLNPMKDLQIPGADIRVYASNEKSLMGSMGSIKVEVNNNGIYQFDENIWLPTTASLKGVPRVIAIDVKSSVPEGDPKYPFTANREKLRSTDAKQAVENYIMEEIVEPAQRDASDFLKEKYNNLPRMKSKNMNDIPIFDSGDRLDQQEMEDIRHDPDMIRLGDSLFEISHKSIEKLLQSKNLPDFLNGLGEGIERTGFVFSDSLHGVHITQPESGKATVFVNPFSFAEGASPTEAASMLWHTLKHEILHDKVKGHYQEFTTGEVKISQALGDLEIEGLLQLRDAYADPTNPKQFREGIDDALHIYQKSRGRPERERDPFGGEESRSGAPRSRRSAGSPSPVPGRRGQPLRPGAAEEPPRAREESAGAASSRVISR